ncbi:MAG: AAA family ATPase [Peptococcaceae bacterium]|nr:AAA family ATPase [Peptococcaceae bacterium]
MLKEIFAGVGLAVFVFLTLLGYNVFPVVVLMALLVTIFLLVNRNGVGLGGNAKKLEYTADADFTFDMIGGQNSAIQELQEALKFVLEREKIKVLGIRPIKGILLTGPPGTGKTLLAKAAANFTDSVFIAVSGSEFIQMYAGVGAERVRSLFKNARDKAQKGKKSSAIIFIDEIDILGGKRGTNVSHHEYDQTLNQLLVEMDGLKSDSATQILVLGATNRMEALDEALLRPGRFDRMVKVDLPDKEGRLAILKIHTRNKPLAEDADLARIAHETFGFSGAHLESLANEAAIFALREKEPAINQKHLKEAIDKVIMGEKSDRKPSPADLNRVAVHEAGHALISELLNPNSVSTVTIRPRGNALGYVRHNPEDESYLQTQKALENQIKIALAGALAEELVLGDRSTGATGDYAQTMNLVKHMIAAGMSGLGVVELEQLPQERVHEASSIILKDLEQQTRRLLEENLVLFKEIVDILADKEYITGEKLRECLAGLKAAS